MNRNGMINLLILASALIFNGCGGGTGNASGDSGAANAASGVSAASPSPTADGRANVTQSNADAAPAATASADVAAARQVASPASASRGAGSAPPAKMPTPRIGSGGNDLFLFTQARGAINNDPDLKTANVVVEVKEGVVTLSGTVASAALKSKAERLVRDVRPKEVSNQLRVSAGR